MLVLKIVMLIYKKIIANAQYKTIVSVLQTKYCPQIIMTAGKPVVLQIILMLTVCIVHKAVPFNASNALIFKELL